MSDDIVTRLRAVLHNDRSVELMNREAADEIERLRRNTGCARDQRSTQFCAEALDAQRETERLRKELAARCGDHGPGAHTAGPVEHFIPEAL